MMVCNGFEYQSRIRYASVQMDNATALRLQVNDDRYHRR